MIEISLRELIDSSDALLNILKNKYTGVALYVIYDFAKIAKLINNEVLEFEEFKRKISLEYCKKDNDGNPLKSKDNIRYLFDKDKELEAEKILNSLVDEKKVKVDCKKYSVEKDLCPAGIEISGENMLHLLWLINP
jgi:hypothetical protein